MSHRPSGLLAAALALLLAILVPAAGATPVSVRIVGDFVGIDSTSVDTTPGVFGFNGCPGHSAGGAIDKAVGGNWDRKAYTTTILGETHAYTANDYWNLWINDTYAQQGICDYTVNPGDRILVLVQRDNATGNAQIFPLTLSDVPSTIVPQQPFTVTVREQRTDGTTTTPTPIVGATVSGGGASAPTDAAGRATLALVTPGRTLLRASMPGHVASDAVGVDVLAAPATANSPPPAPPERIAPADRVAPASSIRGIADGQRFARGAGPRTLRVVVDADPSGLLVVKLRLTRSDRGRCTYFSGSSERFARNRGGHCGARNGFWFAVGDRTRVDYLLPARLPRGRYVLDVKAIDKAYNRDDARRRGANRIVFRVG
ncbi:MAG: hypothetical protein QOJ63_2764 [Solirubrobacteraceae bacterium]|jgi:hypothetical protein|nr:hypothetical protein [Solirubrobacteraceae bacterium]